MSFRFLVTFMVTLSLCLFNEVDATEFKVLTLDESRVGVVSNEYGSINFDFATGQGFSQIRNAMLDPLNFGVSGIVEHSFSLLNPVPLLTKKNTATKSAIQSANIKMEPNQPMFQGIM